jgi:Na+/H+ antiporter NhaD/arsenite permease-like protein
MTLNDLPPNDPHIRHRLLYMSHPEASAGPHVPGYEVSEGVINKPTLLRSMIALGVLIAVAFFGSFLEHKSHGTPDAVVHFLWMTPFILLLGAIATMPFINKHFWEHNYGRIAIALGAIVAVYYAFFVVDGPGNLYRSVADYISFMFLLGSLFVVSGGILIRVRANATPLANVSLLTVGAIIANLVGTTGASMLLIRPFLRLNKHRLRPFHVVFFIFIVANAGGSLTPIGDPPLFLGYLRGVPFFWVIEHCWPIWLFVNGLLLAVFFVLDTIAARKSTGTAEPHSESGPVISLYGGTNLLCVLLILLGILLHKPINHFTETTFHFEGPWREIAMAIALVISLLSTPRRVHIENSFNFAPIKEVALLFIGIFLTMMPALNYLYHNAGGKFPTTPGQYYFTVGALSSVLDNAPTYLTFLKTELGSLDKTAIDRAAAVIHRDDHLITPADLEGLTPQQQELVRTDVAAILRYHPDEVRSDTPDELIRIGALIGDPKLNAYLVAISMGAVLFGACTYIGNGPNFMVKSIADHSGAATPSFFGYILWYTIPVLLPIYLATWWLFIK